MFISSLDFIGKWKRNEEKTNASCRISSVWMSITWFTPSRRSRSDCLYVLSDCLDTAQLNKDTTVESVCTALSPDDTNCISLKSYRGEFASGARWFSARAQDWRKGGPGFKSCTSLWNFSNSVYPALPVSFGGDAKCRWSLLSGVYARGSKNPCRW